MSRRSGFRRLAARNRPGVPLRNLPASYPGLRASESARTPAAARWSWFFSAASVEDQGQTLWVLAQVDGRSQIFDAAWQPAGVAVQWGSDIAGTDARCSGGSQVLATRPGDGVEADSLQAFAVVNQAATAITGTVDFQGPVTALWPSGGTSVLAVAHDLRTGRYAAYLVTVVCGR